jgi:serine/threonine protein kinase/tetratricopeptide (TPR) repeat protein
MTGSTATLAATPRCPTCGAPLSSSVNGLCAACLMRLAAGEPAEPDVEADPLPANGGGSGALEEWLRIRGRRIGNCELLDEIARGGMGIVYRARQLTADRLVAVKVLLPQLLHVPGMLRRFRNETQAVAQLDHPGILPIYEVGDHDGLPFFSMKFAEGGALDRRLPSLQGNWAAIATVMVKVAHAIEHAHERGILHRDLKPANILFDGRGEPMVADFGLAKFRALDRGVTLPASALGSPNYMAPEQISAQFGEIGPACDVYSLGAVLYELLTGRPPILGQDALDTMRLVPTQQAESGVRTRPDVPVNLDAIAMKCLAKHPADRYASAKALAEDIERYLGGLPIAARPWRTRLRAPRVRLALAAGVLIVTAVALVAAVWLMQPRPAAVEAQGIAVLPFDNVSGDPEVEYLSDGLTEDIINRLSRVPDLKVIARDSSYQYKDKPIDPQQVGRELGVQSILIGRVVQRGSSLSVTAELVDTRNRRQIWGERYERPARDIQALQGELAQQIATNLRLQFPDGEAAAIGKAYTRNLSAYEAYLKGRYFWNKRTPAAFRTSLDYFRQAIGKDPDFALAYAGLADSYSLLTEYHEVPAAETYGEAKRAIVKALEIDPDLPEARISLAYIHQFYEWDFPAAEREYRRALERNPNYATGHQWYAEYLSAMGRHDEAIAEIRQALAVDPLSLIVNAVEANILYMAGEYDQAIAKAQDIVAMDPNFPEVYEYLKRSYDRKEQYREAITARQMRRRLLGRDARETPALAEAAATTSAQVYWRKRLEQEVEEAKTEGFYPYEFAEIYAQAGDTVRALDWLERACNSHDFMMLSVQVAPNLEPLRDEARYREIVRRGCAVANR